MNEKQFKEMMEKLEEIRCGIIEIAIENNSHEEKAFPPPPPSEEVEVLPYTSPSTHRDDSKITITFANGYSQTYTKDE